MALPLVMTIKTPKINNVKIIGINQIFFLSLRYIQKSLKNSMILFGYILSYNILRMDCSDPLKYRHGFLQPLLNHLCHLSIFLGTWDLYRSI